MYMTAQVEKVLYGKSKSTLWDIYGQDTEAATNNFLQSWIRSCIKITAATLQWVSQIGV
jgi:hypothetical protein